MSTTTTTALKTTTLVGMLPGATTAASSEKLCPSCGEEGLMSQGHHSAEATQRRIKELETEVQFFKGQTTGTAGKLAEYDEEIRRLHSQVNAYTPRTSRSSDRSLSPTQLPMSNGGAAAAAPPLQPKRSQSRLSTLTSFLPYGRRPSTTPPATATPPPQQVTASHQATITHIHPGPDPEQTAQLQNALNREQDLRKAAENQLSQANTELEELTVQLFSQANEMVAQERRARAKLEDRVAVLERRDVEKRKRLDRLEKAMERVERLRALVG